MKKGYFVGAAALIALLCSAFTSPSVITRPGSFLVFPKFDWHSGSRTELRITNIHDTEHIGVKLNYVCPGVFLGDQRCKALDRTLVLTPHETRVIDVAEHRPPCKKGFVVAFAIDVDERTLQPDVRCPVVFDYLIGSWHITRSKRIESENAFAFQSDVLVFPPEAPVQQTSRICLGQGATPLTLQFGGILGDYGGVGPRLFGDFRATDSAAEASSNLTLLSLATLAGQQNPATSVNIDFWNAAEVPFSTSHDFVCWDETPLDAIDANFASEALGTPNGSLTVSAAPNCPMPGGCPPLEEYDPLIVGAISETTRAGSSTRNLLFDDGQKGADYQPR